MPVNTTSNLPAKQVQDSAARSRLFFDTYGEDPISYNPTEVDAAVNFFEKNGFQRAAATTAASVLLKQAKYEEVPIFKILDEIKGFDNLNLSALVAEILNNNRSSISTLGFREALSDVSKQRNVRA